MTFLVEYSYRNYNSPLVQQDEIEKLQQKVAKQLEYIYKKKVVKMLHSKINNGYLPHCSHKDIGGRTPWQLFHLQGEHKMWITGAITSFDLTQSIINCNRKLLDSVNLDVVPAVDRSIKKKSSIYRI